MADLFTPADLAAYLHVEENTSSATVARSVAYGWLKSATGLADWPSPVPDQLFAWALELAAIAFRNPAGVSSESIDTRSVSFDRQRRIDILRAAAVAYGGAAVPQYFFPDWDWHWESVKITSAIVT